MTKYKKKRYKLIVPEYSIKITKASVENSFYNELVYTKKILREHFSEYWREYAYLLCVVIFILICYSYYK